MRILAVLVLAAALAGCAQGPGMSSLMKACGYDDKPFTAAWPCVRQSVAGAPLQGDLKDVYIASGNFVSEQVTAGKMTDAEAKLAMAQVRQRLADAEESRGRISAGDAIVVSSILNRPTGAPTAPGYVQRTPMNCYPVGNTVQCY